MSATPAFAPLYAEGLNIVPALGEGVLRIKMAGAVEMRDPGDLLTQHTVDLVDALLHEPERGHHLRDDDAEHHRGRRHAHQQDG